MRITGIEDLHADGGWRTFSFLKLKTDQGLVGWAEFNETGWNRGLTAAIRKLAPSIKGRDPRQVASLSAELRAYTRLAAGGINDHAIAAIENACLDVKAKALGVPVCDMLGGRFRDRLRLYWSHCGTFRARLPDLFERVIGTPPLRTLDDIKRLGEEAARRKFAAVKTNPIDFRTQPPRMLNPGFIPEGLDLGQNCDAATLRYICAQLEAFRDGLGPDTDLMMDLNFSFRTDGYKAVAKAAEPFRLFWLEMDLHDPEGLALVRRSTATPIASLESIYGRRNYRPYLEARAVDVAVVDVPWNGLLESLKIAALAETYETPVAPHNFYGPLATLMSAHFCAAVPNFRIMEIEVDDVPWKEDLLSARHVIEDGELVLPEGPGWGAEVNEEAVRAHPPAAIP